MTGQALDDLARRVMLDVARLEYGGLMEGASEHDFSPEFERKMKKLIRQADHPVRHRWLRAAQLAAVLAALLMMATIATAAAGYDIWRMLARWTAEVITLAPGQIQYAGQDDIHIPEGPEEYANIQEALTACGFDRPVVPKWLPEGFTQDELIVDYCTVDGFIAFHAAYKREGRYLFLAVTIYIESEYRSGDNFGDWQKDEGDPIPYEAGGVTHLLVTNVGRAVGLWANGPAECAINGDITLDELKEMIDSIYE